MAKTEYPKEDTCRFCGLHLGWIMSAIAEFLALGICEDCESQAGEEE